VLSQADQALGRLDGTAGTLPNPDLFVAMYVRQEAVLSSQIEGTQASLTDVLAFEAEEGGTSQGDVEEVVNYVAAMNHGLRRLQEFPLSLRLIRKIHECLMRGVRGQERQPGEFRKDQNWIGGPGSTLATATFVPPPPSVMQEALTSLEKFLHDPSLPRLVHAALAHAQFETIHPFLDANGRVGRLLITFLLCHGGLLSRPLLYLSHYLKRHRQEYYDRLQAVRVDGRWEDWLLFFLKGVAEVAVEAQSTAGKILALRERHRNQLASEGRASGNLLRALDRLFEHPVITVRTLERELEVNYATANSVLMRMQELGVIQESTGYRRHRRFMYTPYVALFESTAGAAVAEVESAPAQTQTDAVSAREE
jgi:Fic family protein